MKSGADFQMDTMIDEARNQIEIETKQLDIVDDFPNLFLRRKPECKSEVECNNIFVEFDLNDRHVTRMRDTYDNRAFRPLYSCRKIIGPSIVFLKRVIRKLLKWYVEPVCDQQSDFNAATLFSIEQIYIKVNDLAKCNFGTHETFKHCIEQQLTTMGQNVEAQIDKADVMHQAMRAEVRQLCIEKQRMQAQVDQLSMAQQLIQSQVNQLNTMQGGVQAQISQMDIMQHHLEKQYDHMCQLQCNLEETLKQQIMQAESKLHSEFEQKLMQFAPRYQFGQISSSSQSGEDTIVAYVLDKLQIPFSECTYLELGANHPKAMSNTYLLYRFGARGVLVEANPKIISELENVRKGDIILNRCVTERSGDYIDFYILNGDGLSSPDYKYVQECISKNPSLKISEKVSVETISTADILQKYFSEPPMLVSIDIEGMELAALQNMDLKHCRPLFILVEMIPYSPRFVRGIKNMEILEYMQSMEYIEYAFTGINSIFVPKEIMGK